MIKTGFFWHVHHDLVVEWCHDYDERSNYIRNSKPNHEKELRLKLFKPVEGTLPGEVIKASQAYAQALQNFDKANQSCDFQARLTFVQARQAFDRALKRNMPAINALHVVECPDCPWNRYTIFPI